MNLKEEFLRLLDEDREFRYSVMARLGFKELLERFAGLEERQLKLEEESRETRRLLVVISHRFGILSEVGFYEAMKYVVQDVLGAARVEKWTFRDDEGFVYGVPSLVEVDIAIKDKEHILIEVKSRVSSADVAEFARIGTLYEKVRGVSPTLLMLGGLIEAKAKELADKLKVKVKPVVRETV